MKLGSDDVILAVIDNGTLIAGHRVAVSAGQFQSQTALLTIHPGEAAEELRPVRMIPLAELPKNFVAVGSGIALSMGIESASNVRWELQSDGFQHVMLQELSLELTVEQSLDRAADELSRSQEVCGTLLWLANGERAASLSLEAEGSMYRVRNLLPQPTGAAILEISESTRLQLFAPGAKSGVDIVILADCSGSMSVSDLTETEHAGTLARILSGAKQGLKRSEALRRALRHLLDLRLSLAGRVSRMALVAFNDKCVVRFPRGGGMREMDETAPIETVQEFRDAIGLLNSENASTDIGQALQYAAELLYRHGHPANDRLIVLVSDGAHWVPRGDDATGEETSATNEPISLMSHLHNDMKIHLHAIGISNGDIYMRWFNTQPENRGRKPDGGLIPNHALLEELVRVGGGDPSRTGDSDVLETYFSGLGTGVMRRISSPKRAAVPTLTPDEMQQLKAAVVQASSQPRDGEYRSEIDRLTEEIRTLYADCNGYASARLGTSAFFTATHEGYKTFLVLNRAVANEADFRNFIIGADKLFIEARDKEAGRAYGSDEVRNALHDARLNDLHVIRIVYAHDTDLPPPTKGQDNNERRKRYGEILTRHIGIEHIEQQNTAAWARLHLAIMRDLNDVLVGLRDACRASSAAQARTPQPVSFVWKD